MPGIPDGRREEFNSNGQKILNCHYRNGKLSGPYHQWDDQGNLIRSGYYRNGQMTGHWITPLDSTWNTDATVGIGEIRHNRPVGSWTFELDGKLHSIVDYTSTGRVTVYVPPQP